MHSPFKTLDKILNVYYIIDKGNFTFVIFDFLKFVFRLTAQILVRNSLNVCYNLIAVIGEIREGN